MIREDRSFCDQTLQSVAILCKKFEIFICIFFFFNFLLFFQNIFHCYVLLCRSFPMTPNLNSFIFSKFVITQKNSAVNKKSHIRNLQEVRFLNIDRLLKIICNTLFVTVVIALAGLFTGYINSVSVTSLTRTTAVCYNTFNCLWKR